MKKILFLLLLLAISSISFAQDPNLIYNNSFEDDIAQTWSLVSNNGAEATWTIIEEMPSWVTSPIHRMQIDVTKTSADNDIYAVYLKHGNRMALTTGDSIFLSYYFRSTPGETQLQPILFRTDAPEGADSIVRFDPLTVKTAFGGMKKTSAIITNRGTYELRMCIGADAASYVTDNYELKSYAYQSTGAPLISSFTVGKEQQGDQGVTQIIGRVEANDLEGDSFELHFSILSGGGTITAIDSQSFLYEEETPGEKIFKVIATDDKGNSSSKTTSYTISDFDTSLLYFDENVWELVRQENGYTTHASFVYTENNASLPNVLLMGNSVSIGYTPYVRSALEGKANVYRIPDNGGSTYDMLEKYKLWLGKTHWDVIHFNWGLHDLKYLLNNQLNLNGTQVCPPADYAVNLEKIINILKPAADHLIFATTSHIPSQAAGRKAGDEVVYNNAAIEVINNHSEIMVDDQYTLTNTYPEHNNEKDVHFTNTGKQRQGNQAAAKIIDALEGNTALAKDKGAQAAPFHYSPRENTVYLHNDTQEKQLQLFNLRGQHITLQGELGSYNLEHLYPGIYILMIRGETDIFSQKIAVN